MLQLILAAALSGGTWHYDTTHDPLGQTVHVAQVQPDQARPFVAMRLMCGGIQGVTLQVNLGQMQFASMTGSPSRALAFNVGATPAYSAEASLAPVADGIGTYVIKGSEAGNLAHLLMQGDSVTVHQGSASFTFPLSGASLAIGEVIANCPFKV
ncbi:MAG: hypothetical protein GC190_07625 [Alphaproteobacteria bacterium]|nr:hypothetical protein [Alphaproteobacteria bacterium]